MEYFNFFLGFFTGFIVSTYVITRIYLIVKEEKKNGKVEKGGLIEYLLGYK